MARLFSGSVILDDDWHPLDGVDAPEFIPPTWNGPHVATRLADAWRILVKMPWRSPYPRAFGQSWPSYRLEWHDLLAIVGGGELDSMQREANRVRILPSAKEISQMEQAIGWPWRYLRESHRVMIVNVCARVRSFDGDLAKEMRRRNYRGNPDQWQEFNWKFCDNIADGLIKDRVVVF